MPYSVYVYIDQHCSLFKINFRETDGGLLVAKFKAIFDIDVLKNERYLKYKYLVLPSSDAQAFEFLYGVSHGDGFTNRAMRIFPSKCLPGGRKNV